VQNEIQISFPFDFAQGQDDGFVVAPLLLMRLDGAGEAEALAEFRGCLAMAQKAERTEVVEVALTTAFSHRPNVVGIPQAAARGDGLHAIEPQAGGTSSATGSLQCVIGGEGIDRADSTDAAIARKNLVAKITGVGAQTPLVNAVVTAESAPTPGDNLEVAPPAEGQVVRADWKILARGAAAGEGTRHEHGLSSIGCGDRVRNC
jgi:hypothetical protein